MLSVLQTKFINLFERAFTVNGQTSRAPWSSEESGGRKKNG